MTQGRPLTGDRYPAELVRRDGRFPGILRLCAALLRHGDKFEAAIERELRAQISRAFDFGVTPTHLNGHQYVETAPAVMRVLPKLATQHAIRVVRYSVPPAGWLTHSLRRVGPCRVLPAVAKGFYARGFRRFCESHDFLGADACLGISHAGRIGSSLLAALLARRDKRRLTEVVLHPAQEADENASAASQAWRDPLEARRPSELEMLTSGNLLRLLSRHRLQLGRLQELLHAAPRAGV